MSTKCVWCGKDRKSIDSAWYWRFWLVESQDVRLLAAAVPGGESK